MSKASPGCNTNLSTIELKVTRCHVLAASNAAGPGYVRPIEIIPPFFFTQSALRHKVDWLEPGEPADCDKVDEFECRGNIRELRCDKQVQSLADLLFPAFS